jgi:hypothetical protein
LDNQGNDAKRVYIFFLNERHWQAIRDRVRQWVLSVYAAWQALMPAFFTADLQARIPDDFMPAQAVQDLNTQSPDGRRPTLQNMGLLRRASHASSIGVVSELDSGARRPSRLPSQTSDPMEPTAAAAIMRPAATSAARPCSIQVGPPVSVAKTAHNQCDPPFKPDDRPDAGDEEEYQTMREELPCEELPE